MPNRFKAVPFHWSSMISFLKVHVTEMSARGRWKQLPSWSKFFTMPSSFVRTWSPGTNPMNTHRLVNTMTVEAFSPFITVLKKHCFNNNQDTSYSMGGSIFAFQPNKLDYLARKKTTLLKCFIDANLVTSFHSSSHQTIEAYFCLKRHQQTIYLVEGFLVKDRLSMIPIFLADKQKQRYQG